MDILNGKKKLFLDSFRGGLLISTFIAILAVDFHIFPRRFAKTETFGISLMDVGVGMFLLATALTSKLAQSKPNGNSIIKTFISSFHSALPLLIIGIARIISVKSTDYQVTKKTKRLIDN